MTTHSFRARLLAAALGLLLCVPAAFSQQAAGSGLWAKVPALTAACYSGGDPFIAKLDAAIAAVHASQEKQLAINSQIEEEHKNIDPMEMASRMQQWMMSNPQEATKYLQGVQDVGDDVNARMPEIIAAQQRFDAEAEALSKHYHTALDAAYAPGYARQIALKKKLGIAPDYPTVIDESGGTPDWAVAEWDASLRQLDAAYATNCPQWFGVTGEVPAWLKTYRAWLTQEFIPFNQRIASQNAQTYAIMNTPTATWKDTAEYDGVIKYLGAVAGAYGGRKSKPRCTATECSFFDTN